MASISQLVKFAILAFVVVKMSKDSIFQVVEGDYCYEIACVWEGQGEMLPWILLHPIAPLAIAKQEASGVLQTDEPLHIEPRVFKRLKRWTKAATNTFKVRFGGFVVVHLYAKIGTTEELKSLVLSEPNLSPVVHGPRCSTYIREAIARYRVTVGAWGPGLLPECHESMRKTLRFVDSWASQCGKTLYCLGHTPNGYPLRAADPSLKRETRLSPLGELDVWD